MVCSRCQKLSKSTVLATPGVKKKSEIYYGSPAGSNNSSDKTKTSATLGNNGVSKSKLLSKAAKNPYSLNSCLTCKTKVEKGKSYCQRCAYKSNVCLMCGKANSKTTSGVPVISGQKFTMK